MMKDGAARQPLTALGPFLLDLLDFIDEKMTEAGDRPSRRAALADAAGAIPIIRDRLRRENKTAFAQVMLIGFIEADPSQMAGLAEEAFALAMEDFRGRIAAARNVIASIEMR